VIFREEDEDSRVMVTTDEERVLRWAERRSTYGQYG